MERPKTVSVTRLDRLSNCVHSMYLDLSLDDPPSHPKSRGTLFHLMAERAVAQMQETGEAEIPGEVCRELMQSVIDERTDLALPEYEQDALRGMAFNFGELHTPNIDLPSLAANEMLLAADIGGWTIRGRVDRAHIRDEDAGVIDYKTSYNIPSNEKLLRDLKLKCYCLLLGEGREVDDENNVISAIPPAAGVSRFWPRLVFPRYTNDEARDLASRTPRKKVGEDTYERVPIKREDFYDLRRSIGAILSKLDAALESGEWPATPGSHCSICPCQPRCPIPADQRELEEIPDLETASKVASAHHVTDKLQKRRRDSLKEFAAATGQDIPFGDSVWTLDRSKSKSGRFVAVPREDA